MIRFITIFVALLFTGYILFVTLFFKEVKQDKVCHDLQIVVKDSLEKHFVNQKDLLQLLASSQLTPLDKPMEEINTEAIEQELLKNEMIADIQAYKTPSGMVKLEVKQKMPILRVLGAKGNFYVDNTGSTMPVSRRYVAHVPIATGYVEKELATTDLYKFALFLQENEFWNNQIEQIHIYPDNDVELIPRVGNHRIMLGTLDNFREKLDNLQLFYEKVIPKTGWEKYTKINLKYNNQIICTKK
ncbi:MAG: cell division protein FtsQ [Tannerellaceae bacterium]|nr:cell division protein FtsQ [Tannerellaceae bacterium]MCD8265305.1 cell division protein FtsQ [Tannerellaceae bacterium]